MTGLPATLLSLGVIAALLLSGTGIWMAVSRKDVKRGLLMLVAGLAILANVLVWTWPAT